MIRGIAGDIWWEMLVGSDYTLDHYSRSQAGQSEFIGHESDGTVWYTWDNPDGSSVWIEVGVDGAVTGGWEDTDGAVHGRQMGGGQGSSDSEDPDGGG